ncbi:MAG TPA: ABC transporter permease [Candidatus Bathyarchaeia archaeon]
MSGEGLKERKARFALNLIGILIGCAAVTGLVSITQGLSGDVSRQLEVFGPQNINIVPGRLYQSQFIPGANFGWKDFEIVSKFQGVNMATPMISDKFCSLNVRGDTYVVQMFGLTPDYFTINKNMKIAEGRGFTRTDASVAIIGSNVAQPRDKSEPILRVGDRIRITVRVVEGERTLSVRVIGVLQNVGGSAAGIDDSIGIPLRSAQQLLDMGGEFNVIVAQANSLEEVDEVAVRLKDRLGDEVFIMTFDAVKELASNILGAIQAVLAGVAAISLFVAGVGIINTMTVSVMERTREIGTMKAIGAKSTDVLVLFLAEAIITGISGGFIGAGFGFLLSNLASSYVGLMPHFSPVLCVGVTMFAVSTCILSGLYPAWRASKMNPVEALRRE